jgi:hypothetical protein
VNQNRQYPFAAKADLRNGKPVERLSRVKALNAAFSIKPFRSIKVMGLASLRFGLESQTSMIIQNDSKKMES